MPVPGEHAVAESVNGRDCQLGKVAAVSHFTGCRGQAVAHLERRLLGERAKHDLPWPGLSQEQEVQGPQDNAVGLAGPRTRDHEQRAVKMTDNRTLALGELRVVLQDRGREAHNSPAFRKLKTSSGDTIR